MAINSVTDLRNTDPTQTAFTVRQNPVGGTTSCHAVQVTQGATAGDGAGLNVVSNNASAAAVRVRAACPLVQLRDAANDVKFEVSNTGATTLYDALALTSLTTTGNATVGGTLSVTGATTQTIDAATGVAALGAKNSLSNVRLCGVRSSVGAPSTGTWVARDTVVDSTGALHLCSTGGTPGTWITPLSRDLPAEQNLLAWTYNPDMAGHVTAHSSGGVAGRVTLVRIPIRSTITWSNIWLGLAGVDAGASLTNCYLGVYDTSGTLLATTADVSSSLSSSAVAKALPLATPFTATPGMYFIAMLLNGTWTTNSFTFKASGAGISVNAGLSAPNLRYSNLLTAQTSLPASVTLANQATSIINTGWASQWYGIS